MAAADCDEGTQSACRLFDDERWVRLSARWETVLGWNQPNDEVIHLLQPDDAALVSRHLESLDRAAGSSERSALWLTWKLVRQGDRVYALGRSVERERRAKRDQQDLRRKLEHAQRQASLGLLASGIAHDFNNVLTTVLGNASLALVELSEHSPIHPVHRELEAIIEAAQFASTLCRQLLAYAGSAAPGMRELELSALIRSMSRLFSLSAGKRVELKYSLADGLGRISADPVQVGQVVMNLVSNSRDAMGELHGTVEVRTGQRWYEAKELEHGYFGHARAAGEYVFVAVSDTGAGMLKGTLEHLFDPFFSTKGEGRGLGLAATLGIVNAHHGAITVQSEPGRGATFQVLFPLAEMRASPLRDTEVPRRA